MNFRKKLERLSSYRANMDLRQSSKEITKTWMQELWFLRSACLLILINIYMKFGEDSLNGFQVIERT